MKEMFENAGSTFFLDDPSETVKRFETVLKFLNFMEKIWQFGEGG